jgi:DNA-binding response OmpR family regulator
MCAAARRGTAHANATAMPARIFVAEDDPEMLRLIVEALRGDGHDVEHASDGGRLLVELARARPEERAIDLVVSDIRMPTCTGMQILEALRAAHRKVPVILMTAFGDDDTRNRAERLGAVLFDKPFVLGDLRAAVTKLLAT